MGSIKQHTSFGFDFGCEILGPIFYEYCHLLHSYCLSLAYDSKWNLLFMSRGGFRLKYLFDLYRKIHLIDELVEEKCFFVSRFSVARACLYDDREYVSGLIEKEFIGLKIKKMIFALLGEESGSFHGGRYEELVRSGTLLALLEDDVCASQKLSEMALEQRDLFGEYLSDLIGGSRRLCLVDTGWTGNTQAMLMRSFPQVEWLGLYFGKWNYSKAYQWHFADVVGISVEGTGYNPFSPSTAIFFYHHLIEGLLEPTLNSTEGYLRDLVSGTVVPDNVNADIDQLVQPASDEHVLAGVVEYFQSVDPSESKSTIRLNSRKAYKLLARKIMNPTDIDLKILQVGARSADFGKEVSVPVVACRDVQGSYFSVFGNLRRALWKQGQIVLDCGGAAKLVLFIYNSFVSLCCLLRLFVKIVHRR